MRGVPAPICSSEFFESDPLSAVMNDVRLVDAMFVAIEPKAPWVAEMPAMADVARRLASRADHVVACHFVARGSCWAGRVGETPVRLEAGDVVVFPHGDANLLSSAQGSLRESRAVPSRVASAQSFAVRAAEGGDADDRVISGFFGCDAGLFDALLSALPCVVVLRPYGPDDVLHGLVHLATLASASSREGAACVWSRLSELLFVELVRRQVVESDSEVQGWLAGLRDDHIGRALRRIHTRPAHDWTLETLARECGVSRSVLAERFARLVGVTPMQYLTQRRIHLAASLLRTGSDGVAQIAARVGYRSEAAFSRAFKRCVGIAPGTFRRAANV